MIEPSATVFRSAQQYLNLARFSQKRGNAADFAMALVTNYAFSIELMLKSFDTTTTNSVVSDGGLMSQATVATNIYGHDFNKIYNALSPEVRTRLDLEYKKKTGADICPLITKFKDYFIDSRYIHDLKSSIVFPIWELQSLAEGIEYVLENWYTEIDSQ